MADEHSLTAMLGELTGPDVLADQSGPTPEGRLAEFVRLDKLLRQAEATQDSIRERRDALEKELVEWFGANGFASIRCGDKTVYRRRELHVSVREACRESVIAWAQDAGMGELVKEHIPPATLKARIKEMIGEELDLDQIPADLLQLLCVYQDVRLRVKSR